MSDVQEEVLQLRKLVSALEKGNAVLKHERDVCRGRLEQEMKKRTKLIEEVSKAGGARSAHAGTRRAVRKMHKQQKRAEIYQDAFERAAFEMRSIGIPLLVDIANRLDKSVRERMKS